MRADKDFKTYEQALIAVQRFGDLAEDDHRRGEHQQALYNLSHATFVGVKHLLFMAADAAVDRAEARQLAAKNHLATVELISLAIAALRVDNPAIPDLSGKSKKSVGSSRAKHLAEKTIRPAKARTTARKNKRTGAYQK